MWLYIGLNPNPADAIKPATDATIAENKPETNGEEAENGENGEEEETKPPRTVILYKKTNK